MTEEEKMSYIKYLDLKAEFKKAAERGVILLIAGRYATPEEAAGACAFRGVDFNLSSGSFLYID